MSKKTQTTLKNLLENRLAELGCTELPAQVKVELENQLAAKLDEAAGKVAAKCITGKKLLATFAAHLGVRRDHVVPPPKPRA